MQYPSLTTNRRKNCDLSAYQEEPENPLLLSVAQHLARQIKTAASTIVLGLKTVSNFSFGKNKSNHKLPCCRPTKKEKVSDVTQQLIKEINAGFDPLELSKERWLADQIRDKKDNQQSVENIKESYIQYLKKSREEKRTKKEKVYVKIKMDNEEQNLDAYLWQIAEEKIRISKKKIQEWTEQQQQESETKIAMTQSPLQQSQTRPLQLNKVQIKLDQNKTPETSQKGQNERTNEIKQDKKQEGNSQQKEETKDLGQKKDDPTPKKFNPFLTAPSSSKSLNLNDLISKNSFSNLFGSLKPQTQQSQPSSSLGEKDEKKQKQTSFSYPLPSTSQFHPIFNSQKRKQPVSGQSVNLPSNTFGSTFMSNLSSQNQQKDLLGSNSVKSSVFQNISSNGSESQKIIDMFSDKPKTEGSLFQDSRSDKTGRKTQTYTNRRTNKKDKQLRVS